MISSKIQLIRKWYCRIISGSYWIRNRKVKREFCSSSTWDLLSWWSLIGNCNINASSFIICRWGTIILRNTINWWTLISISLTIRSRVLTITYMITVLLNWLIIVSWCSWLCFCIGNLLLRRLIVRRTSIICGITINGTYLRFFLLINNSPGPRTVLSNICLAISIYGHTTIRWYPYWP